MYLSNGYYDKVNYYATLQTCAFEAFYVEVLFLKSHRLSFAGLVAGSTVNFPCKGKKTALFYVNTHRLNYILIMDNIIMRSVHHLLLPDWYKIATSVSNMQNIVFGKWYIIGIAGVLKKNSNQYRPSAFWQFHFHHQILKLIHNSHRVANPLRQTNSNVKY